MTLGKEYEKGLTSVFISIDDDYEVEFIRVVDLEDFYIFDITPDNFEEYKSRLVETTYLLENGYSTEEFMSFDGYLSLVSMQDLDNYSVIILWKGKDFVIVYDGDSGEVKKWHKNSLYLFLGSKGCLDKTEMLGIPESDEVDGELVIEPMGFPYYTLYSCGTAVLDPYKLSDYDMEVLMVPADATVLCSVLAGYKAFNAPSKLETIVIHKKVKYVILYNKIYDKTKLLYGLWDFLEKFGDSSIKKIVCSRETKFISLNDSSFGDKFNDLRSTLRNIEIEFYD